MEKISNGKVKCDEADAGTFLPGVKPVLELLESTPERVDCVFIRKGRRDKLTDAIIDACRASGVRFSLVEQQRLTALYPGNSQGALARIFSGGFSSLEDLLELAPKAPLPLIVALDQVEDPGNAGTLARSLYALGGAGLLVTRHQGAFLGPAAQKAAAGALQKLPVAKVTNLSQALDKAIDQGFTVYGAAAGEGSISAYGFKPVFPAVLVMGSEEAGLRPGVAKRCSSLLRIPMRREFNSLNVAQAGGMLLALFNDF
ncbi:MAG: RNA methyltransferase [Deltaproteobacteria bacterium]|jgi:23S rRNA (guanosine2251-2'-O)-methyltransferase|nr:RNA methyltransferase [Deltaproteobacteria bacterium]